MTEIPQPNGLEQQLRALGLSEPQTAALIINHEAIVADRRHPRTGREEYLETGDLYGGDYNGELARATATYYPYKRYERIRREIWPFRPASRTVGAEHYALAPVEIVEQTTSYVRNLVARGVEPVRVVDFGAGGARTVGEAAIDLAPEIREGKARVLATNLRDAPTPEILELYNDSEGYLPPPHAVRVAREGLVTFAQADIVELYERMKDQPIHLLFMVNTFPATKRMNDSVLKILANLLDPQYGTAVFGIASRYLTSEEYRRNNFDDEWTRLLQEGLQAFTDRGFRDVVPFQVPEGISVGKKAYYHENDKLAFKVFQGSDAPPFDLFTVQKPFRYRF